MKYKIPETISYMEGKDNLVVRKPGQTAEDTFYKFDDLSKLIIQLIIKGMTREEIIEEITLKYSINKDQAAIDLDEFLKELCHEGIIVEARN